LSFVFDYTFNRVEEQKTTLYFRIYKTQNNSEGSISLPTLCEKDAKTIFVIYKGIKVPIHYTYKYENFIIPRNNKFMTDVQTQTYNTQSIELNYKGELETTAYTIEVYMDIDNDGIQEKIGTGSDFLQLKYEK